MKAHRFENAAQWRVCSNAVCVCVCVCVCEDAINTTNN